MRKSSRNSKKSLTWRKLRPKHPASPQRRRVHDDQPHHASQEGKMEAGCGRRVAANAPEELQKPRCSISPTSKPFGRLRATTTADRTPITCARGCRPASTGSLCGRSSLARCMFTFPAFHLRERISQSRPRQQTKFPRRRCHRVPAGKPCCLATRIPTRADLPSGEPPPVPAEPEHFVDTWVCHRFEPLTLKAADMRT